MKAILTPVLFLIVNTIYIFSQPFGQSWVSRYNGPGNNADWAYALTLDNPGNVYVTGYSYGAGTGKDLFTIKYNSAGQQLWSARYNGPNNGGDYSFAIVLDHLGNVYVTGRSDRGAAFLSDYTTIKYDNNGIQQWVALYDGPDHNADEAKALCVDGSGNVYVTGKSFSTATMYNITTIKYNTDGVQQWVSTYNGTANGEDRGNAIGIDNSGNIYVSGETLRIGFDFVLVKIDPNGTQLWSKYYNGPAYGGDGSIALNIDASGNIYTGGYSDGGITSYDFAVLKYDGNGNELWARRYNSLGNGADIARAMTMDINGNVYITGSSTGNSPTSDSNFASLKYDPNGNLEWSAFYVGPNFSQDVSRAITTDNNLNVYITGSSTLYGMTQDYITIKYSLDGSEQWLYTYNGPDNNNDYTSSIAVNNSGEVFVTGRSFSISGDYDYTTIKYGSLVGITQTGNNVPERFKLYQNYPNPFNPTTKIRFDIANNSPVKLVIYNSVGAYVFSEDFGSLKAGEFEYTFDAASKGLSSGVYFIKLITNDYINSMKMMLIK